MPQANDNLAGKPFASNRQALTAKPGKPLPGEPLSASGQRRRQKSLSVTEMTQKERALTRLTCIRCDRKG